jgi:hypothetical protein
MGMKRKLPAMTKIEMQRKFLFIHLMEEDHLGGPK